MTVDAYMTGDWISQLADLWYKEKEQKGRFGEIGLDEKIMRGEHTLHKLQSKVFLMATGIGLGLEHAVL